MNFCDKRVQIQTCLSYAERSKNLRSKFRIKNGRAYFYRKKQLDNWVIGN